MHDSTDQDLERRFDSAMMSIYERARAEAGYNAVRFLHMLNELGGLRTARELLQAKAAPEGYTALWERGRLDLTMEAMIADNPQWHPLFDPDELEAARRRLTEYGYFD